MKAVLLFDLDDDNFGDREEFARIRHTTDICSALWDFENYLRQLYKYTELGEREDKMVNNIADKYYEIMREHGINLDELY